ncbi:MAG: carboxypeptidase regulatory-like domain-containing protein, partial [Bacteroidia bacterium]|nr:carboxypeptidase regulatory-like domain-containing protein [Bacteroidia bacterium]
MVSFPQEPMLSRIQKIAETAKENGQSITYETIFLDGITAPPLTSEFADVEIWLRLSVEDTPITYSKISDSRFIVTRNLPERPKSGTLSGKITDTFGTPLVGATVWFRDIEKGVATGMNGDYSITLAAGVYAAEIRFLGFEPQRVEQIEIGKGQTTRLHVAMKESPITLTETEIIRKLPESAIIGALQAQRNTPYIGAVLSREEINRSMANSVRDALKLIPGTEIDESGQIIIRGAGGRWNEILLNGISVPNYASAHKLFSLDLLPLSIVDNIRILKSATPDIPVGFGNAIAQIITKDIPEQNFVHIKTEHRFNTQSAFQNQRTRKRGKWDFIGLDDGSREITATLPPSHFRIHDQKTPLSQQYSATIGKTFAALNRKDRYGLIFSLSYGNTQQQSFVYHTERSRWKNVGSYTGNHAHSRNFGHIYGYQTAIGGMLNAGWQRNKNRVAFRNVFSRSLENNLSEISQHLEDIPSSENNLSVQFFNYPTFSSLIQNKLDGQHGVKNGLLKWYVSHTLVERERKDAAFSELYKPMRDDSLIYFLHRNPTLRAVYPAS